MNHTPPRFLPVEVLPMRSVASLPAPLKNFSTLNNYKGILVRLLTGTISIYCEETGKTIQQKNNYSTVLFQVNRRRTGRIVKNVFSSYASMKTVEVHFNSSARRNIKFYREVLFEFYNYFYQTDRNNHSAAFLHLYRVLESIAYSFPLIWASRAKDYERTFMILKSYFAEPRTGELGVFKKFFKDFINPTTVYDVPVTLVVMAKHPDWQKRYFDTFEKNIDASDVISLTRNSDITLKFGGLVDLVIKLRNQYFHSLTGQAQSFSSDNIPDADEFFSVVNELFCNWLAVVFFQLLEFEISL
ncbi:MAG: hypothetical protein J0M11_18425 [Anaerolineae bacterium]|nr:hypothetical protein [Anaerolineae bacterium]